MEELVIQEMYRKFLMGNILRKFIWEIKKEVSRKLTQIVFVRVSLGQDLDGSSS